MRATRTIHPDTACRFLGNSCMSPPRPIGRPIIPSIPANSKCLAFVAPVRRSSGHSAHAVLTSLGAHALGRLPKATYVPWGRPEAAGSFHSSRLGGVFCNSHLAINRWAFSCSSGLGTYSSFQLGTPTRRILFVSIACPQKFSSHTVSGAGLKSAEHPFLGRSEPPVGKATELFFLQRFLAMAQSASFPPPRGPALRGRRTDPCGAWLAAVSPK